MLTAEELNVLYEGIKLNKVNQYDYILTGESRLGHPPQLWVCRTATTTAAENVTVYRVSPLEKRNKIEKIHPRCINVSVRKHIQLEIRFNEVLFFFFKSLQGYSRDTSFLEMVVDIILELKKANPSLVYGEHGCFL